jgi:RHS repeat-associated protein
VAAHTYYPFGSEVPSNEFDGERLKFTGHERDLAGDPATELDYMHARYYAPGVGRMLTVDPKLDLKRTMVRPQLWNRYAYALNNPLIFTDPTGTTVYVVTYTVGNDEGDDEFRRAAETHAAEIQSRESFDPEKDKVILSGVRTKADFARTLADARSLESKYGRVGELSMFSHAGPKDGPTFHHNVAPLEQFSKSDLQSMNVNWEWWGAAKFFGCNTGLGFTQRFANAQGVTAYGFSSFAGFSGNPVHWSPPFPNGPMYMVQSNSNYTTGGTIGALKRYSGIDTSITPMHQADPK